MSEDLPVFDDDWVANARHHEHSVDELERAKMAERRILRRRKLRRYVVGAVAVAGLAVVGVIAATVPQPAGTSWVFDEHHDAAGVWASEVAGGVPTPTRGETARLLPEVSASGSDPSFAFIETQSDGAPVTYDPCRVVEFVVNPEMAPDGYLSMVDEVLAEASAASGLALELVDFTDEPATVDRPPFQPDRYGDRWAPVLVAWTDESVIPDLEGSIAGIGGSAWIRHGAGRAWYVSGILYIDRDLGDDPVANRAVLRHELAHVLGLDHVDDPDQVMHPTSAGQEYGPGDLAGLAQVGAGGCAGSI